MAGYRTVGEWAQAMTDGKLMPFTSRKVPLNTSVAGRWVDLSMGGGSPPANYYAAAPLVAATLDPFRGIYHGDDKAPASKFLAEMSLCTPTAGLVGRYILCDYLLFYPFVDLEDADEQIMDNTVTLPRYEDGDGVMAMMVAVALTTGGGSFTFDYIDNNDQARTSPVIFTDTTAVNNASIATSGPGTVAGLGPFMRLTGDSKGVKQITAYRNITPTGGLAALVLVKTVAELAIREVNSPSEYVWGGPGTNPPRIVDGAFHGFIMNCAATVAAGTLAVDGLITWT